MKTAGEKAMALVDGQLAPAEVPELVAELARSPALVAELQAYVATAGRRMAEPFAETLTEPPPAWLVDEVRRATPAESRPERSLPESVPGFSGWLKRRYPVPAWSLAAGPALAGVLVALGASLGVWLAPPPAGQGSTADASLGLALEKTASGKEAALVAMRPVLTFRSRASEGRTAAWCRQYELHYASKRAAHGLACRSDGGRWDVLATTPPAPHGPRPAGPGPRKAIDDLVTAMMSEQPLSSSDEAAAIGKGWSRL